MSLNIENELVAFLPRLRLQALKLTRNADDADDLVQQSVVQALAARHSFNVDDGVDGLRGWVTTILKNVFKTNLRKNSRMVFTDDPTILDLLPSAPPNQIDRLELQDALKTMATLPSRQAHAVFGVAIGQTYREVAACNGGVCEGTVKSRVFRGRAALAARNHRSA